MRRSFLVAAVLTAAVALGLAFALGWLAGARETSDRVHVDRDVDGEVTMVDADGNAVVIDTGRGEDGLGSSEALIIRRGAG